MKLINSRIILIVLLLSLVFFVGCSGEEMPTTSPEVEQILFVKMINNTGKTITMESSCRWDQDYLSDPYYLDLDDFKVAPGEAAAPSRYNSSQLGGLEELGDGKFKGAVMGIVAPITEEDITYDTGSIMVTVVQTVTIEASYGDMALLKWNGASFDVEVVEYDGSEFFIEAPNTHE